MMTHQHLCLHLLDRVKRNTDDDDDRGAAQCHIAQARGDYCTDDQREQSDDSRGTAAPTKVTLPSALVMKSLVGLPGRKPGMKPPFFFRLLAISIGLNWMDA